MPAVYSVSSIINEPFRIIANKETLVQPQDTCMAAVCYCKWSRANHYYSQPLLVRPIPSTPDSLSAPPLPLRTPCPSHPFHFWLLVRPVPSTPDWLSIPSLSLRKEYYHKQLPEDANVNNINAFVHIASYSASSTNAAPGEDAGALFSSHISSPSSSSSNVSVRCVYKWIDWDSEAGSAKKKRSNRFSHPYHPGNLRW